MDWTLQFLIGASISAAVAAAAVRLKALTVSGALAACLVGTLLFACGGWSWLALVGAFFFSASALTAWTPRGGGIRRRSLDREGRHWDQVAANGGIAAVAAAIHCLFGWASAFGIAAGAVAAATADTWGTEVGRWSAQPPRLITSGASVPAGTSGGVTIIGTIAEFGGALLIGIVAAALAAPAGQAVPTRLFAATVLAGFSAALLDSVLGATVEGRVRWVTNSVTNVLATAWGAGMMLAVSRWWR